MTKEELQADMDQLDKEMLEIEGRYGHRLTDIPNYMQMLTRWRVLQQSRKIADHPPTQQLCEVAKFISEN